MVQVLDKSQNPAPFEMTKPRDAVIIIRMTTAIDTIEDLVRVLDDNPEWLEALRARLLSRELLELPNTFAKFAEEVNRRFDEQDRRFDEHDRRFDEHDRRFDEQNAKIDRLAEKVNLLAEDTNRRFDEHGRAIQRLQDDVGILKAAHARNAALRDYGWLTRNMGLRPVRIMPVEEVDEFAVALREMGVLRNELESFRKSDMIIEAASEGGETLYIAVEVSFTVDERDTGRAMRNASFLTRITGAPARAAVVGASLDDRVRPLIASGKVHWHMFSEKDLQVD